MEKILVDGKGLVFGRLSSYVAKELLKGKSVVLFNCEEIIISGKLEDIGEKIKRKRKMGRGGSMKGPKYIREADRLIKRMIRGMLPWDRTKGREAYKNLKCYVGNEILSEEDKKLVVELKHKRPSIYVTVKDVVRYLK